MAGYEPKPGDVTLYKERDKTNDKAPDWKGFALVTIPDNAKPGDTVRMEIAVWNKGNYGTMLGGKISEPRKPQGDAAFPKGNSATVAGGGRYDPFDLNDSEIPF
jgi:hypothetical protein